MDFKNNDYDNVSDFDLAVQNAKLRLIEYLGNDFCRDFSYIPSSMKQDTIDIIKKVAANFNVQYHSLFVKIFSEAKLKGSKTMLYMAFRSNSDVVIVNMEAIESNKEYLLIHEKADKKTIDIFGNRTSISKDSPDCHLSEESAYYGLIEEEKMQNRKID